MEIGRQDMDNARLMYYLCMCNSVHGHTDSVKCDTAVLILHRIPRIPVAQDHALVERTKVLETTRNPPCTLNPKKRNVVGRSQVQSTTLGESNPDSRAHVSHHVYIPVTMAASLRHLFGSRGVG